MSNLNLIDLQTQFLEKLESLGKSFNTLKNYKTDLNIFNQFLISNGRKLELQFLTIQELRDYSTYLDRRYNSPNSIRRRVQALRLFSNFLITQGHIDTNPIKKISVSAKRVDLPNPTSFPLVILFKDFIESKIESSDGHEKLLHCRNLILFYLIYGGGLKVSDIEKLQAGHISKSDDALRVMINHPKRDPYTIPLPQEMLKHFNDYQTLLAQRKERNSIEFNDLLFNGNPFKILSGSLSPRGIEVIFKEFSREIKEDITAKHLRQACIFKWLCQNAPESSIKEWMGVQPQYSLVAYTKMLSGSPENYTYMDI